MDQLTILQTPEDCAIDAIKSAMRKTLQENWLDESYLSVEPRKGYQSVLFNGASVVVRISSSPKPMLSVPTSVLLSTESFSSMVNKPHSDYTKLKIDSFENIDQYVNMLQEILQVVIDRFPKDFDCCSRYLACSDAKRCVHPNTEFSLKCGYRKILRRGRIFYGKNRNID